MIVLCGVRIADKISTKSLLKNLHMLSINQVNAQSKLMEIWKSVNVELHPLQVSPVEKDDGAAVTRSSKKRLLKELGSSNISSKTFINDATHIWNKAPISIRECNSLFTVKKEIRQFIITLPI